MKVFVVYASAGAGHCKSAEAIYDYFKKKNPVIDIRLIDALDYSSIWFKYIYVNGYALLVRYAPWLWGWAYQLTYIKLLCPLLYQLHFLINKLQTAKFANLLIGENPDFIISTHFLPAATISYLKVKRQITSRSITVITDFGLHPFWLSKGTDIYIVASEFNRQQLLLNGVGQDKIKVLGIPIHEKFLLKYERSSLLKKFNLDPGRFNVLVVTGSFGVGPIEKIVDLLYADVQMLVVCARNKGLFVRLQKKNYPHLKVFGFVDNIEELMAVSDIIITKPGGLTISEFLSMGLVPLFICAIPGQETANVEALKIQGIGSKPGNPVQIRDAVLDYKANSEKLKNIKSNIAKAKRPLSLEGLYNVICPGSSGASR